MSPKIYEYINKFKTLFKLSSSKNITIKIKKNNVLAKRIKFNSKFLPIETRDPS